MEWTLGVPRREAQPLTEMGEKGRATGQRVTFLTWGQSSWHTEHKASLSLSAGGCLAPTTFHAFFGVPVAEVCVWRDVGLCAVRKCLMDCRPFCLAASTSCLPQAPLSGPTDQLG